VRRALFISLAFHGGLILLLASDILNWSDEPYMDVMQVEIIEYDDIEFQAAPEPVAEEVVEEPDPEPEPAPPPKRAEDVAPPEEIAPAAVPDEPAPVLSATRAIPNITPRDKPKPPSQFNLKRIEALLDKREAEDTPAPAQKLAIKVPKDQPQISDTVRNRRLASIQSAIASQISECWNAPAGASYAETLVVRIRIFLAGDGSLSRVPEIMDSSRLKGDSFFRAAAEAARRAIQRCAPLELPVEQYDIWREVVLNFDPSKML
jgi:hypothetical protein